MSINFISKRKSIKDQQSTGFALQEVALALLILLIVGIVALTLFSGTRNDAKVSQEISELPKIAGSIQALYSTQPSFDGITMQTLVQNRVFPESYGAFNGTTATNQWGGAITVASAGNPPGSVAELTWPNVPSELCSSIVNKISPAFSTITVAGTLVKSPSLPLNLATLTTSCGTSGTVTMILGVAK